MSKAKSKGFRACSTMAHDVERLATITAHAADGTPPKGAVFGQGSSQIFYEISCARKGKFGPGQCSVYAIERSGPGVARFGLKARDTVGNLHGLARQISRDLARMWCGSPQSETGFQGLAGRRRRKRRK